MEKKVSEVKGTGRTDWRSLSCTGEKDPIMNHKFLGD